MTNRNRVLTLVLAGGKGERLYPLTKYRTKPAVPFAGKYRIVDFVLSNLINSGFFSIYIITQYKAQSLTEHIEQGWQLGGAMRSRDFFITLAPAQMWTGGHWFLGTADAVFQNLHLIATFDADVVLIFSGDHICKMDIAQFLGEFEQKSADAMVAVVPVPKEKCCSLGVVEVDENMRVKNFVEKPEENPPTILEDSDYCFASMGNYIFDRRLLEEVLIEDNRDINSSHDFGKDILPRLCERNLFAYDFSKNSIPNESASYWRDVGTLEEYYDAHIDLLSLPPSFNLYNSRWPIRTISFRDPPAVILSNAQIENCLIAEGVRIYGGYIKNSVIGRNCVIHRGARIESSILHYGVEVEGDTYIRKGICDKFVKIEKGMHIDGLKRKVISDVFYDEDSKLWVYSSPSPKLRIK